MVLAPKQLKEKCPKCGKNLHHVPELVKGEYVPVKKCYSCGYRKTLSFDV